MRCIDCNRFGADDVPCKTCALQKNALAAEIVTRIYASEVNFTVRGFYDAGFEWELWGETPVDSGSDGSADTFPDAAVAMAEAAASRYPDSPFARWWRART